MVLIEHEVQNIYIGEYTKPREPDSNTIVYWKLDGDAKDSSWNNRDGTVSWTLTYESIGSIDVAKFTWGQSVYRSWSEFTLNNNSSFTFSVWAKVTSWDTYNYSFWIQKTWEAWTWDKEIAILRDWSVRWYYYTSAANWCTTNSWDAQLNQWYHLAYTYDWSVQKVYINWTLVKTNTPSSGSYTLSSPCLYLSRSYTSWYSPYKWYLSNFILQKNAWTADYISNYFNTYKWLYWLS